MAVLINKAMIEIPPKFAGRPAVDPESQGEPTVFAKTWRGAQGLAEDVRHYRNAIALVRATRAVAQAAASLR